MNLNHRPNIVLPTLILLAGIQLFQVYLDSLLNYLSQSLPAEGLAGFALLTFGLVFLLPLARRLPGSGWLAAAGLLALRLAVQFTGAQPLLLILATLGVVLWMGFLASARSPLLVYALPLAFFLDTLTRSLIWFDQLAYLRSPLVMLLVTGFVGLAFWLLLRTRNTQPLSMAAPAEPPLPNLLPFAGLGTVLYLGMFVLNNPARLLSAIPGLAAPLAYFLINLLVALGCLAAMLPAAYRQLRRWYIIVPAGLLLTGCLQAMVANAPLNAVWTAAAVLLMWFLAGGILSANQPAERQGLWRSSLVIFLAFLVMLVAYFLVEQLSLHAAIPAAGAILALAALANVLLARPESQAVQMVGGFQPAAFLFAGLAAITGWVFLSQPGAVDGTPLTPVFTNGSDGYACFRIPSIIRAGDGTLVAFAEARQANCGDAGGVIRIVARRSSDNGRTWGALQVVGQNLQPDGSEAMAASPAPVVDLMDPANPQGVIFLLFNQTENSEFDVAAGHGDRRVYATRSLDHGQTWSEPQEITAQVMRAGWRQQVPAVGHAIQLRSGRLFYTAHITIGDSRVDESQNYVFWSDDHGQSWVIGGLNPEKGHNESMAVELENGAVMVNARAYANNAPVGLRAVMIYPFDSQGGIQMAAGRYDPQLVTPTVASSIIRLRWNREGGSILLFSGPDHPRLRVNMTVRLSRDEGQTWLPGRVIDPGPSAYSDLVVQQDGRIGLLYERGNDGGINYTSFSLEWLSQSPTGAR